MQTADFDFELPAARIAQQPAEPRDSARLMVLPRFGGEPQDAIFRDLPSLLRRGDLLVMNDTRVMAARLFGVRPDSGGRVEALLLRPDAADPQTWQALMFPMRQAVPGRILHFEAADGPLEASVIERTADTATLRFAREIDPATAGCLPLPPYITDYKGDPDRYQTIYANEARSAAAPTAGLHFTPDLFAALDAAGVERAMVTLEVGIGTFKPVKVDNPEDHVLHQEHITVPAASAEAMRSAKSEGRRVIAVGTTVIRTLEHVARECGEVREYAGWTGLKILPGDPFLVIDGAITNFHLPKSTLLMLICALAGTERVLAAYREAVAREYNFYSFGDAMLILP